MHFCRTILLTLVLFLCSGYPIVQADVPNFTADARQKVAALPAVKNTVGVAKNSLNNKPVLVTFFASWCPPCLEEFAHLNNIAKKYSSTELQIVAINVYEAWDRNDAARMQKFIDTTKPVFPTVVGSEAIRHLFGGVDRIPTVLGFGAAGEPVYRFVHKRGAKKTNATYEELDLAARQLLAR